MKRKDSKCVGIISGQWEAATASNLNEYTIMTGETVVVKKKHFKAKIIFNMKSQYNYQLLFARIIIFIEHMHIRSLFIK